MLYSLNRRRRRLCRCIIARNISGKSVRELECHWNRAEFLQFVETRVIKWKVFLAPNNQAELWAIISATRDKEKLCVLPLS